MGEKKKNANDFDTCDVDIMVSYLYVLEYVMDCSKINELMLVHMKTCTVQAPSKPLGIYFPSIFSS